MALNTNKTKIMVVSKNKIEEDSIYAKGKLLGSVHRYQFLGCELNEEWDRRTEIKQRIEIA
ncbi:unnamed protein product [Diabrotica balteata]|uniref:Uncharacterized protein n=1 Tax=Diabrotica balteata TaxID=107213 RepID=A0A9N9XBA9_DIABA|nr:unnamed protein product [Diabrotica balteata]